jgi:hypothetical protein
MQRKCVISDGQCRGKLQRTPAVKRPGKNPFEERQKKGWQ